MAEEVLRVTGVRYEGDSRKTGSYRYEVADGCFLTLFDDGRVRFLVDPRPDRTIHVVNTNTSNRPGAKLIETKPKAT
ncbi:hypothetical protein FHS29_004838 [Saccharothrix tamanrassetensis]|uniref:Uncharacterized protein n=1 Tax=Saccharothrix tamanrassetensis TaxID=1051531 RepID=A0A841CM88_9PSEU|nr:hypothetical protein [Saccharothrix tamanrassetensis]MBB5958230.1 hypothetical protein [Saccharothrix tamanrassetensis]